MGGHMSTISASTTTTTAYKVTADTTGTLVLQTGATPTTAVTVGTDQSVTLAGTLAVQSQNMTPYTGFKNRIINGAMVIDQRNAGASVTLATGHNYVVDRLNMYKGTAGATVTGQQASASIAGFEKCAVWTTTVASAPAAGDINGIWQVIEGLNTLDLQWGTANAKACTVSFWFKATTSGTYALSILSGGGDLSYVATFSATSTFTYFSFSIPAPTTGTFYKNTLAGMYVTIDAGSGTNYNTATTGSWIAGNFKRTSACVNSTANTNTLSLTGFQFEVGSTATSFDYRPYGTELALCQRYYVKFNGTSSAYMPCVIMAAINTTNLTGQLQMPVKLRDQPSSITVGGSAGTYATMALDRADFDQIMVYATTTGLTAQYSYRWIGNADGTSYISVSVEL